MLLAEIVDASRRVQDTTRRLQKVAVLADCLRRLPPHEIKIGVHYLSGRLTQGRIGIGGALLRAARPGAAARDSTLTLSDVDAAFAAVAQTAGAASGESRRAQLHALFERATPSEQDFLLRLLNGSLLQGALEGVMLDALAHAADVPVAALRRAVMVAGDVATVASAALLSGRAGLAGFVVQPMQPIRPMLAQTADDVAQAMDELGPLALEYKIDGARVQVHKTQEEVRVFSRRLNDITATVPEIVSVVRASPARELILDGEAIALTPDRRPLPFQATMRRFGRKLDIDRMRAELPLSVFFFDALRIDGDDLTVRPSVERIDALAQAIAPAQRIPRRLVESEEEGKVFLAEALARGHEGVMAKALAAPYEAGNRGSAWRKIKRAHTLDLVVLAAEWGHGRRRAWLSNLHLGARDQEGGFVMLGKTFKGMTDAMLVWQTRALQAREIGRDGDIVYVRPELVVEVVFNDIQSSTNYPGGLALRFARIKNYRPDKTAQDADSIDTVRALYAASRTTHETEASF